MPISRLSLTDFRSYADAVIAAGPGPGFVVLTGENGAGKTNVLEAISLLAPGRGLRGAAMGEIARQGGGGGFGVSASLQPLPFRGGVGVGQSFATNADLLGESVPHPNPVRPVSGRPGDDLGRTPKGEGLIQLGTGTLADAPERRIVRINGASATATALGEWLSLIWLTPAQDRLFSESAGGRRRFLDRLVLALDPAHAHDSTRYEAAMRQRNRLLAGDRPDTDWLGALEAAMAVHGTAVAERRAALVTALTVRLADAPPGPFARACLSLDGFTATDQFPRDLAQGRVRDAAAGRTLAGPQRQDLVVTHLDKGIAAASSSTGEQKALLIGIILAHAALVAEAHRRRPILLLDEVAAHLDPVRRIALFERLAADGGQVWLTGTEAGPFDAIDSSATWLTVAEGRISER